MAPPPRIVQFSSPCFGLSFSPKTEPGQDCCAFSWKAMGKIILNSDTWCKSVQLKVDRSQYLQCYLEMIGQLVIKPSKTFIITLFQGSLLWDQLSVGNCLTIKTFSACKMAAKQAQHSKLPLQPLKEGGSVLPWKKPSLENESQTSEYCQDIWIP